jgi:hypothetical protein
MASYARNHQQQYQSGGQSYDQYERRQHPAFPGRSSTPPRQQQQPPYRQAQPPSPMTIEQYQASRRATANMTPQRQRNVSPQRQRNATPQRAPPPGKFSTQPQNAYRPPPPQQKHQQQAHPQPHYRQAENPQYNQNRNMGQNLQYHQNPHQVQHPQYQNQNPQYPQSNNFTNQNTTQNYVQQKSAAAAAAAAAGMIAQSPLNRNLHQEQRQANSPMSRRDYFQQAQQMQLQQEDRQAVDMEDQYNIHIMREREAEVAAINAKMNKVNDIYKDLAGLIDGHQDLIDQVDVNIEESHAYTKGGITNYEEARLMMENPIMEDFFGDKLSKRPNSARPNTPREAGKRRVRKARDSNKRDKSSKYDDDEIDFQCDGQFDTIQENLIDAIYEMKEFGSRVFLACTGPDVGANEYATYH